MHRTPDPNSDAFQHQGEEIEPTRRDLIRQKILDEEHMHERFRRRSAERVHLHLASTVIRTSRKALGLTGAQALDVEMRSRIA